MLISSDAIELLQDVEDIEVRLRSLTVHELNWLGDRLRYD